MSDVRSIGVADDVVGPFMPACVRVTGADEFGLKVL